MHRADGSLGNGSIQIKKKMLLWMDNRNSVLVALGLEKKRDGIVSLSLAKINLLLMFYRPHACLDDIAQILEPHFL